jgi:membrane protease YdiL (CAAX protease family)
VRTAAAVLATALVVMLVAVLPPLGRKRQERWRLRLAAHPGRRVERYVRLLEGEGILLAFVAVVGILADRSPASIALRWGDAPATAGVVLGGALCATVAIVRRHAGSERVVAVLARQPRLLPLLPRTRRERLVYAGVALSAGFSEEVAYRGFGLAYARWALPADSAEVVLLVAAAFSLAHLYQGLRGIVGTFLAGLVLGALTVWTRSLVPAIVLHCLVDLRPLLFAPAQVVAAAQRCEAGEPPPAPAPA